MIYRNKLGTFSFDDDVQESHMKLIVQNVTGQYLNARPGEPKLTDEESCYEFIRGCGNVLAGIGFELEIAHDVRHWTKEQLVAKKIRDFDAKIQNIANTFKESAEKIREATSNINDAIPLLAPRPSFGGWLVGPAAVK